jgi:hypothetical protein
VTDQGLWLRSLKKGFWAVSNTDHKDANNDLCWAQSVWTNLSLPTDPSAWIVFADQKWGEQGLQIQEVDNLFFLYFPFTLFKFIMN